MKSVLEALGSKLQSAGSPPQKATSPTLSQGSKGSHVYVNVPVVQTSGYQSIPTLVATSVNGTCSPSASSSHYDIPRIVTTQQPPSPSQSSTHETAYSRPMPSSKPMPSPRQSPSQSRSQYAVPRPISSVTTENSIYDVPRASIINQPLSPTTNSWYDIPRIASQIPASKSHYDVPRQPAAESLQSFKHLPRTSSDPDLSKDTIKVPAILPKVFTPPVTPRKFTNKAKTLDDKISYKDMQQYNTDAKENGSKKKPFFRRRQS